MKGKSLAFCLTVLTMAWFSSHTTIVAKDGEPRIKKRIAVFVFDDKTDRSWGWWDKKGIGEGVSDMLIAELAKTGSYQVIEREELDQIIQEQDFGKFGGVTPESAAQIGKILGLELAVMGAITEFGYKKSKVGGRMKGFGARAQDRSAAVAIDCRMVNATTGEIVRAENVREEKSFKGIKVDTRKIHFKSQKEFDESLVGKAARDALKSVIALVDESTLLIPWQAEVMKDGDGEVLINAGSRAGIEAGDEFVVYRKGEDLVDPESGLSLGSVDSKLGVIKVTNPDVGEGKASECRSVEGSGFKPGDIVRLK